MNDQELKRITNLPDNTLPLPALISQYVISYFRETGQEWLPGMQPQQYFDEAKQYYSKFFKN